jgi:hypothetical protein
MTDENSDEMETVPKSSKSGSSRISFTKSRPWLLFLAGAVILGFAVNVWDVDSRIISFFHSSSGPGRVLSVSQVGGFGPSRRTYNWDKYTSSRSCTTKVNAFGRCGSINPVFDSFINQPSYGDEENFVTIAAVAKGVSPLRASFSGSAQAVVGHQYWVRLYVNNDANQNYDCLPMYVDKSRNDCSRIQPGASGVATDTTVRVAIPVGVSNGVDIEGYISARNATPTTVWDSANLGNYGATFSVWFVPGSARIYDKNHPQGEPLPDAINSPTGTLIGCDAMDGNMAGTFDCSAYVFVRVEVSR